ncbi:MAG: hypothetical protein ABIS27_10115 [Longimicrobiales bacterium]
MPTQNRAFRAAAGTFLLSIAAIACGGSDTASDVTMPGTELATFARIQASTLTPTCATIGCHTGASVAASGALNLDKAHAYESLVGVAPANLSAKSDGMLRVKAGNADNSFLMWKLLFHRSPQGRDYGNPMPSGGQPITNGEIEYIRRWIAAGAPREGFVADTMVLADHSRFDPGAFTPLALPVQGFQMHIAPFTVQPNFERELFVYEKVGNTTDVFVNRIETKMRLGSHHFLVYSFRTTTPAQAIPALSVVRDIRNTDGSLNFLNMLPMAYHVFLAGSMTPTSDFTFPTGVALRIPANATYDLNAHYANTLSNAVTGEAYVNLHTTSQAQVTREAKTLDMANTSFSLPPRQRTTTVKSFTVSATTTIFLLTSHMHKRGEKFVIKINGGPRNGEVVYTNTDWEHPMMQSYATAIVLQPGQGLTSEITYNNDTDRTITFGLTSEDEMGIIFGYYY